MGMDSATLHQQLQDQIDQVQHQIDTQGRIGALVFHEYIGMIAAWKKVQYLLVTKHKVSLE